MYLRIKKTDYYYGVFLSLIINQGLNAEYLESGVTGNVYSIANVEKDKVKNILVKYKISPSSYKDYWNIYFTPNDLSILRRYSQEGEECLVCLVLTDKYSNIENTEILILKLEELRECIDFEVEDMRRLSIQNVYDSDDLSIYGSIRESSILGADNKMKINRNRIYYLFEEDNDEVWNLE